METTQRSLELKDLLRACAPGGGTSLRVLTELAPAGGVGALVAPARVLDRDEPTYAFERRLVELSESTAPVPAWTVIIDSKQSVLNRDEDAVLSARRDGETPEGRALLRVPTIEVSAGSEVFSDLSLPHRVFDGHIRSATLEGKPVTQTAVYRQARNATRHNARALLELAPTSLILGAWDSTRKFNQGRYQSCIVGEIVGVLADQDPDIRPVVTKKAASRIDPVAASVRPTQSAVERLVEAQSEELSEKLKEKILNEAKKKGSAGSSMSTLGLGHIPPSLDGPSSLKGLGGVSCRAITRRRVLSFSALRQLRFGGPAEADIACRALLAAYGLLGMALSDRELYLRANCDLVELSAPQVVIDQRFGQEEQLAPITPENALSVFEEALRHAEDVAKVQWQGQVLHLEGDPDIIGSLSADDPEK